MKLSARNKSYAGVVAGAITRNSTLFTVVALAAVLVLATACGGSGGGPTSPTDPGLSISLKMHSSPPRPECGRDKDHPGHIKVGTVLDFAVDVVSTGNATVLVEPEGPLASRRMPVSVGAGTTTVSIGVEFNGVGTLWNVFPRTSDQYATGPKEVCYISVDP